MVKDIRHLEKILPQQDNPEVKFGKECLPSEQKKEFTIEIEGQKFNFLEIQSANPSNILLVHLPGFGEDVEKYAEPMHILMGKSYCILALKEYGEVFLRKSLVEALEQAIILSGKRDVILHGDSFGAGVVYDLISDPTEREFLKRRGVRGAILEAPFLDKKHLNSKVRSVPDNILVRGSMLFDKVRNLKSLVPQQGLIELSRSQKKSIVTEALREKTTGRKIEVPVHVVFVQDENLSDNEKIMETLRNQANEISSNIVRSASDNGHHVADEEYEDMWRKEKSVVNSFIGLTQSEDAGKTND